MKCFFPIKEFSTLLPALFMVLTIGLISFQLFKVFINRGKSQSCQSICPLTRSAFTPFSFSSTILAFPVTSLDFPSISKDYTLNTSFLSNSWISAGCVPVMTGKFTIFWTYVFTISLIFPFSQIRIFFVLL